MAVWIRIITRPIFSAGTPNPRNSASPLKWCGGGGGPSTNVIINEVDSDAREQMLPNSLSYMMVERGTLRLIG